MMKKRIFIFSALAVLVGLVLVTWTRASATLGPYAQAGNPFKHAPISGVINGSPFKGTVEVIAFNDGGDELTANMKIDARMVDSNGEEGGHYSGAYSSAPTSVSASCDILRVTIKSIQQHETYISTSTKPVKITVTTQENPGLRDHFCAIAQKIAAGSSQGDLADEMNIVLAAAN